MIQSPFKLRPLDTTITKLKKRIGSFISFIRFFETVHGKVRKTGEWDFEELCDVTARVVKFRINDEDSDKEEWEVLLTNLPADQFPVNRMKYLYHMRWDIETSFRHLKYALGAINFHSKKTDFIEMEILAHLTMFNAVSRIVAIAEAARVIDITLNHFYAIDFKTASFIIRRYFNLPCHEPPDKMLLEIQMYKDPVRKGRSDARNMKPKKVVNFLYRVA